MVKVLFVCYANTCRSPMAEGLFRDLVERAGLAEKISVDSAGTSNLYAGEPAHSRTVKILLENGIDYSGQSRQLVLDDFYEFDYILAMDKSNLRNVRSMQPPDGKALISLLLDYAENVAEREVPDPYPNGRYDETFDLIEAGATGFLKTLRATRKL